MSDIIDSKSHAILHVSLRWESEFAGHVETFYVPLNIWRELDLLPPSLAQALAGEKAGTTIRVSFPRLSSKTIRIIFQEKSPLALNG